MSTPCIKPVYIFLNILYTDNDHVINHPVYLYSNPLHDVILCKIMLLSVNVSHHKHLLLHRELVILHFTMRNLLDNIEIKITTIA